MEGGWEGENEGEGEGGREGWGRKERKGGGGRKGEREEETESSSQPDSSPWFPRESALVSGPASSGNQSLDLLWGWALTSLT